MGTILDAFRLAWRDFNTDGVPASLVHEITKSEARAIGPIVEGRVAAIEAAQGAATVVFATVVEMNAHLAYAAYTQAQVPSDTVQATTFRSRASNVATITVPAHGRVVGNGINVSGLGGSGYNVSAVISAVTTNTISYASTGSDEGSTADTAGLVNGSGVYQKQGASGAGSWLWLSANSVVALGTRVTAIENNKSTDGAMSANSDTLYPSQKAVKTYADNLVIGLLDDRGNYSASGNVFPSSGGSGSAGAILKGDLWFISVAGTLGGAAVNVGDQIRALVNAPGQTSANWSISEANIGFAPENAANKSTDDTFFANSDTLYPSQKAVLNLTAKARGITPQFKLVERVIICEEGVQHFIPPWATLSLPYDTGLKFFAKAFDLPRDAYLSAVMFPVHLHPDTVALRYKIYRRLKSAPSDSGPGVAGGDQLVLDVPNVSPQAYGCEPGPTFVQLAKLPINLMWSKDYTLIVGVEAKDVGGVVLGLGTSTALGYTENLAFPSYRAGWYGAGGWNGFYSQLTASVPLAGSLLEYAAEENFLGKCPGETLAWTAADLSPLASTSGWCRSQVPGNLTTGPSTFQKRQDGNVCIPETYLERDSGVIRIPEQLLAMAGSGIFTVTNEANSLVYNVGFNTLHQYVHPSTLVVRKETTPGSGVFNSTLTLNTDYYFAEEVGTIIGKTNTGVFASPVAVQVDYQAGKIRYDLVYADPDTGDLGIAAGTLEYIAAADLQPACPAGKVPLYMVRLWLVPSYYLMELIPVHAWDNYVQRGKEKEHRRKVDYNRARLPRTTAKQQRGEPIRFAFYGDSNTSSGGSTQITRLANGDNPSFYTNQRTGLSGVITDLSAIYNYTEDGNTKIAINWPHYVKAGLEQHNSPVQYGNFGVPGSGTSADPLNGSNTDRMAELIKWVPDVVFIVLGINSFSRTTLTTIVTTFKAAGIEVVLVTIPKWNFYSGTVVINWQTQKAWKRNCEVQVEIAKECDVAVVNLADIFALGCEGATGISQRDLGECNTLNHMGPLERRKGGEYIALMTFGGRAGLVPSGLPTPVAFKSLDARSSLRTSFALWTPLVGTNGIATIGLSPDYVGVSQVARTLANTSFFTAVPRLGFLSDTTAGSSAGIFGDSLCCWRGNAARLGGFCLTMRFGVNAWQTNGRLFAGLRSSAAAIGNVDPSSLVNIVGVGADAGQTTLRLLTNDGSGTATATDLGARFPINTSSTEVYELTLSCEPNSSVIRWRLERLNTAANDIVEGEVSANLPVNSVFLTPHLWINNGATAAAVAVDLVQMQLALMTR